MADIWRVPPASLKPPKGKQRTLRGGPLLDLTVLQDMLAKGGLTADQVWVATDRCERDLENERWSYEDVLLLLSSLKPGDFKNAEWCLVKGGALTPCDVYRLHFDFERGVRNTRGLEVYLKFSVSEDGQLTLVLVSCHGSR